MNTDESRPLTEMDHWRDQKGNCDDQKFGTGARRSNDAAATRYDLITPIGLEEVARAYAEGATKYAEHNWEQGMPVHDLLNHAIRHVYLYLGGDRSEPHLGHAAWGLLAAIHSDRVWPRLNEPHRRGPGCTLTEPMRALIAQQTHENLARRRATKETV